MVEEKGSLLSIRFIRSEGLSAFCNLASVIAFIMLGALPLFAQNPSLKLIPKQDGPEVKVEFLGAEDGFAVGTQSFTTLCIVRNVGNSSLPQGSLRLRCYTLANLDYLDGQLRPLVPPLAPNQSASFRWRLAPTSSSAPLTFAAFIERSDVGKGENPNSSGGGAVQSSSSESGIVTLPTVKTASIPHFSANPKLLSGLGSWGKIPQAIAQEDEAWVGNDRVFVHALTANGGIPILTLAAKDGAQWKQIALVSSLAVVNSGEDGQIAWRETFKWRSSERRADKESAVLTLIGTVGSRWSATLTLEAKRDTGAVNGRLKLTARRNLRCFGVQLPRLVAEKESSAPTPKADGVGQVLPPDPSTMADTERMSVSHVGSTTFGMTWSSRSPFATWRSSRLPVGDPERTEVLGGQWDSDARGEIVAAGDVLEFKFRIFAFGPSYTVRDAMRFALP